MSIAFKRNLTFVWSGFVPCRLAGMMTLVVLFLLLLQFGCAPRVAPMSDAAQAKDLLQRMLDDWKSGTSLDELKRRDPPVYFTEDLWRNGAKLNGYSITGESDVLGSNIRFKVHLKCINKGGKAMEKPVRYIVTTRPALTIVREEG